jgi:hypothetical protein
MLQFSKWPFYDIVWLENGELKADKFLLHLKDKLWDTAVLQSFLKDVISLNYESGKRN